MSKRAFKREAGILLPITSLPSRYGIGDLGSEAFKFADFLGRSIDMASAAADCD